jgi:Protein of unknown function (DUF1749)
MLRTQFAAGLQLSGVLSGYGPKSAQQVHVTGTTNKHLVVVGGLTDGLKADGFAQPFLKVLEPLGWSLALAQLQTCCEVCQDLPSSARRTCLPRVHVRGAKLRLRAHE